MRVSNSTKATSTNGAVVSTKVGDPTVTTAELDAATLATPAKPKAVRKPRTPKAAVPAKPKAAAPAKKATKVDRTGLATKAPTQLHKNFAKWLEQQVGVEVDLKTVQLCASLRHDFQRSDANQKELATRRTAGVKQAEKRLEVQKAKLVANAAKLGLTFSS